MSDDDNPDLDELARQINGAIEAERLCRRAGREAFEKARSLRVVSGQLALEAQARFRIERPGQSWKKWCQLHIGAHRYRDLQKRMALARDSDPDGAASRECEAARDRMRRLRQQRTGEEEIVAEAAEGAEQGGEHAVCSPPSEPEPEKEEEVAAAVAEQEEAISEAAPGDEIEEEEEEQLHEEELIDEVIEDEEVDDEEADNDELPPQPPEIDPPEIPGSAAARERTRKLLRMIADPSVSENERQSAIKMVQRLDPRLDAHPKLRDMIGNPLRQMKPVGCER